MTGGNRRSRWLWIEVISLFVALPAGYAALGHLPHLMLPLLVLMAASALVYLLKDTGFDRSGLTRTNTLWRELPSIFLIWLFGAVLMYVAVCVLRPDALFVLLRTRPRLWLAIVLLYPLISVYPQEIIWRAFFFQRYRSLFRSDVAMVAASAVAFGWVHIVMWNGLAVALSLVGGFLFGWRYLRSRSIIVTAIEHALYGQLIFTVGLGIYFHATFGTLDHFFAK